MTVMSGREIKALLGGWGGKLFHPDKGTMGLLRTPSWMLAEDHEGLVVLDNL
jgi:hypothetical protein